MENNSMQAYILEILEEYEKNKNCNIDELITTKLKEKGATDETIAKVKKSFELIEENNKNLKDLKDAKRSGKSRKQWLIEGVQNSFSFLEGNKLSELIKKIIVNISKKFE